MFYPDLRGFVWRRHVCVPSRGTKPLLIFWPTRQPSRAAFLVTQRKSLKIQTCPYCKTKSPVELKRCKTPFFYRVYNPMKLKPQKERQFKILEYGCVTWKPAIGCGFPWLAWTWLNHEICHARCHSYFLPHMHIHIRYVFKINTHQNPLTNKTVQFDR